MDTKMRKLCEATQDLADSETGLPKNVGTFQAVQLALFQLANDPTHEGCLKDVITAAIVFHIEKLKEPLK